MPMVAFCDLLRSSVTSSEIASSCAVISARDTVDHWALPTSLGMGTWINGVYCTGKTVEEVNSELLLRTEAPNIVIVDREGTEYTISLAEADYQADYSNVL